VKEILFHLKDGILKWKDSSTSKKNKSLKQETKKKLQERRELTFNGEKESEEKGDPLS